MTKAEPQWTPGPWTVVRDTHGKHRTTLHIESNDPDAGRVAQVLHYQWMRPRKEWFANADLLAAAPDLYAALEALVEWLDIGGTDLPPCDAEAEARAALAAARGET